MNNTILSTLSIGRLPRSEPAILTTQKLDEVAELADTIVEATQPNAIIIEEPTNASQDAAMAVPQSTLSLLEGFRSIRQEIDS